MSGGVRKNYVVHPYWLELGVGTVRERLPGGKVRIFFPNERTRPRASPLRYNVVFPAAELVTVAVKAPRPLRYRRQVLALLQTLREVPAETPRQEEDGGATVENISGRPWLPPWYNADPRPQGAARVPAQSRWSSLALVKSILELGWPRTVVNGRGRFVSCLPVGTGWNKCYYAERSKATRRLTLPGEVWQPEDRDSPTAAGVISAFTSGSGDAQSEEADFASGFMFMGGGGFAKPRPARGETVPASAFEVVVSKCYPPLPEDRKAALFLVLVAGEKVAHVAGKYGISVAALTKHAQRFRRLCAPDNPMLPAQMSTCA